MLPLPPPSPRRIFTPLAKHVRKHREASDLISYRDRCASRREASDLLSYRDRIETSRELLGESVRGERHCSLPLSLSLPLPLSAC